MAFNIKEFKTGVGELLRPYTYEVIVTPPDGNDRDLRLRTESISLPGVSFAEVDNYKPYGNGLTVSIPHTATVQEITCVHNVDGEGQVLQTFFDWANEIVDLKKDNKFSAYYYNDYTRDLLINIYNLKNEKIKTYKLIRSYPQSYDQVQMSWESGGEVAKLSVTYKFEYFELN